MEMVLQKIKNMESEKEKIKRKGFYKGKEEELCFVDFSNVDMRNYKKEKIFEAIKSLRLQSKKPVRKIFVISDVHIPFHNEKALLTAILYAKEEVKPDELLILGDLLDFKAVSFFNKKIEELDLANELRLSVDILKGIIELFDEVKRIVYIEGNHEERIFNYTAKKALPYSNLFKTPFDILRLISHYEFDKKMQYYSIREKGEAFEVIKNRLFAIHGDEYHKGVPSLINITRNILEKAKKNMIFGHWHVSQEYTTTSIDGEVRAAWSVGCLSNLRPEWKPLNNWNWGFAVIYVYDDNFFTVGNKKIFEKSGKLLIV
jgi:predicted phosphodiesterase